MNLIITNYGHYRVTDHGKGQFVLFNRQDDLVLNISEENYNYIRNAENEEDGVTTCQEVENETLEELANGITWPTTQTS